MNANASRPGGHPRITEFTAPLSIPGGDVAGAEIVRELGPEVSLAVWQTLRGVLMWSAETPSARPALFDATAMRAWERELLEASWEPELRYPLAVLVGELAGHPTPEPIARACLCVTDWALARDAWSTGLAFAEAAALSWPEHPRYAWTVGRLLRKHGRLREAEQWIQRCVRVAVAAGDWEAQTLGLNSLGNVFYETGNYPRASRALREALRVARKSKLKEREGEILHDLFSVTMCRGDLAEADKLSIEAFHIYRSSAHHRLPALVHDVMVLWLKRGEYPRALAVLKELPAFFGDVPEEQVRVYASLARAAGECGDAQTFAVASAAASELARDGHTQSRAAPAMLEIGLGASVLQEWSVAERALAQAIDFAGRCGDREVLVDAETALARVRKRMPPTGTAPRKNRLENDPQTAGFLDGLQSAATTAG
jgi:tetratricopeptide (TPR) repeat protein